eukprot:15356268-Ditylum_brightwellii.AAC.1
MADVKVKANGVLLDVNCAATVFKDTFVSDPECAVDDELEELEREAQAVTDTSQYEDDSESEKFVDDTAQDITYVQVTGALDLVQSYIIQKEAPSDDFMALNRLQRSLQ